MLRASDPFTPCPYNATASFSFLSCHYVQQPLLFIFMNLTVFINTIWLAINLKVMVINNVNDVLFLENVECSRNIRDR